MYYLFNELTSSLFSDMTILMVKELKQKPKIRKCILLLSIAIFFIAFVVIVVNEMYFNSNQNILVVSIVLIFLCIYALLVSSLSYFVKESKTIGQHLEEFAIEREVLSEKIKSENNVMDVIKINLNQLSEYYIINKVQAKRSYSFSITMIVTGFVVLIVGIALWFYGKLGINFTIIASLAGVIAEFIGATSLFLYKESTKQIQLFFEKLSYLQHVMLAVELAERLSDVKKEEQISTIISSLIVDNKIKVNEDK